jgi:hypothetical protein
MRIGSSEEYNERIRAEAEQSRINTAQRKAKKANRAQRLRSVIIESASPRNTGNIDWIPKHSAGKEKWQGILQGKKVFKIEKLFYKYSLKILNEELAPKSKIITERSFEEASKKAEKIVENYLNLLKKKNKDEVSKNNSAGR